MVIEEQNETESRTGAIQTCDLAPDGELKSVIDRFIEQVRALHTVFELLQSNEDAVPPKGVDKMNLCTFKVKLPPLDGEQEPQQHELRYFDAARGGSREIYFFDSEGDENQANLRMTPDENGQMSTFICKKATEVPGELHLKKITIAEVQISENIREVRAFISLRMSNKEQTVEESITILGSMSEFLEPFVHVITGEVTEQSKKHQDRD